MAQGKRNYQIVFYPESAPTDFIKIIKSWHVKACLSPLHSIDVDEHEIKPHYHLNIMFDGVKPYDFALDLAMQLGSKRVTEIISLYSMTRYLIHFDDDEKEQFNITDLTSFGGFDYFVYFQDNYSEESCYVKLEKIIFDENFTSIKQLSNYLLFNDSYNLMSLVRKNAYYFNLLLNSNIKNK